MKEAVIKTIKKEIQLIEIIVNDKKKEKSSLQNRNERIKMQAYLRALQNALSLIEQEQKINYH